jgi:hypothetical protein
MTATTKIVLTTAISMAVFRLSILRTLFCVFCFAFLRPDL